MSYSPWEKKKSIIYVLGTFIKFGNTKFTKKFNFEPSGLTFQIPPFIILSSRLYTSRFCVNNYVYCFQSESEQLCHLTAILIRTICVIYAQYCATI